ncbi:GNAT family N-acetyltransferase [Nonomuraea sp. NPDC050643]|uniref:GNAT family N-acetyltransferase n=1 Tax=Nonomuraea sp. NPDC050643 TaxID=3155660 RepID=UPI0033F39BBA
MEIRRIREGEGETVCGLWDRMCAETPGGGPLSDEGRRDLARMLSMSAWHRDAFCLVAEADDELVGFVKGRLGGGDGLLPGLVGEIDSLYALPRERGEGVPRALAEAAVGWLLGQGARTVRHLSDRAATADHDFWQAIGFEADLVCLSLYRDD